MSRSRLIARNVLATLATQLVSWGLTFAVTLYLPRYVGDVGLGRLTFAASFVAIFGVFVPLGTSTVLVKEIARDRGRTGELLLAAILLRVPLGLVATLLAVVAAYAFDYSGLVRVLIVVAAIGLVVGALNDALASALRGQENMPRQSAAVLVEKFLSSGLTVALIFRHAPLWALAAVGLFTGTVSLLVNLTAFRRLLPPPGPLWDRVRILAAAGLLWHRPCWRLLLTEAGWPTPHTVRALALAGLPFMGYGVFATLYGQSDPIVLKFVANDATVGWYSAAFRLVGTTLFLPTAVMSALLPTLSRLHLEGEAEFRQLARRTLTLIMLCGIPIALLMALVPDRLVALMHYPPGFSHCIPVLRVGGLGVFLYYAASVLANLVTARDDQAKMLRVSVIACVFGIPACVLGSLLTQRLWHNAAIGAMASDALLEAYLVVCYLRMLPPDTFGAENYAVMGRCVLAALPMAVILSLSAHAPQQAGVAPACLLIYGGLCWLLRCIRPQDMRLFGQAFARKVGA